MSNASNYKTVMEAIATDQPIDKTLYDEAVEYAKSAKRKAPRRGDDWACDLASTTPAKKAKTSKALKVVKVPAKVKKLCSVTGCPKDSYSKGMCAAHYTAVRRQDPAEKAKANLASRVYRERKAAEKADTQVSE